MRISAPAAHAALSAASLDVFCDACNDWLSNILICGTLSETLRLGKLSETQGTMHADLPEKATCISCAREQLHMVSVGGS